MALSSHHEVGLASPYFCALTSWMTLLMLLKCAHYCLDPHWKWNTIKQSVGCFDVRCGVWFHMDLGKSRRFGLLWWCISLMRTFRRSYRKSRFILASISQDPQVQSTLFCQSSFLYSKDAAKRRGLQGILGCGKLYTLRIMIWDCGYNIEVCKKTICFIFVFRSKLNSD